MHTLIRWARATVKIRTLPCGVPVLRFRARTCACVPPEDMRTESAKHAGGSMHGVDVLHQAGGLWHGMHAVVARRRRAGEQQLIFMLPRA